MHTRHSTQLSRAAATVVFTVILLTAPALAAHAADPATQPQTATPQSEDVAQAPSPQVLEERLSQLNAQLDAVEKRLNQLPKEIDGSWSTQLEQSGKMVEAVLASESNRFNLMLVILGLLSLFITGAGVFGYRRFGQLGTHLKEELERAEEYCADVKISSNEALAITKKAESQLTEINAACMRAAQASKDAQLHCDTAEKSSQKIDALLKTTTNEQEKLNLTPKDKEEAEAIAKDSSAPLVVRIKAKAILAEEDNDWDTAVTLWNLVVTDLPFDVGARIRLLFCLSKQAEDMQDAAIEAHVWEEIIAHCQAVTALSNRNAVVYFIWGLALDSWAKISSSEEQAERFAEACCKYEKATTLNPEDAAAYNNWGATLDDWAKISSGEEQAERFAEACRKYEMATTLNPEYADAYNNWGNALLEWAKISSGDEQAERFAEACRKYEKATTLDPELAVAYNNWGIALGSWAKISSGDEQAGRFAEACRKFDTATTLNPEYADAYTNWGSSLLEWAKISSGDEQSERFAEACRKYEKATTLNPEHVGAYTNWGSALLEWAKISSGDEQAECFAEACRKYEKATMLNPEYAAAYGNWGSALLEWAKISSGNEQSLLVDEAEEKVRKAEELRPGIGAYNLACVAALHGQPDTCRHWLATTYQHQDTPTADHLASDTDLVAVRDQQWFTDLVAERRRIEAGESVAPASPPPSHAPDESFSPKPAP